MKQDLTLNIGSKFNGEGLKKMDSALKDAASSAKTATNSVGAATRAIGAMGDAVGGLDGKIGKVAGSLQSLFGAFTQGGIVGAAIAGVTTVVTLCINKFKEMQEAAIAATKAIGKGFQDALNGVEGKINNIIGQFNKVQNNIGKGNQFNQQMANLNKQGQINAINQRHAAKQLGMNAEQLALDNKLKNAEIAQVNANTLSSNHAKNIKTIDDQIAVEDDKLAYLNKQIELVNQQKEVALKKLPTIDSTHMGIAEMQEVRNQMAQIEKNAADETKKIQERIKQVNEARADLQNKRALAVKQSEVEIDAANLNAGKALLEYGQAKVTDYAKQGLEKANAWLKKNVKREEQPTPPQDNIITGGQKIKYTTAAISKKVGEEQQKLAELKEQKEAVQQQMQQVKEDGRNDLEELARKLAKRLARNNGDVVVNLGNIGNTSFGDIKQQRRKNDAAARKNAKRVANIQRVAKQAVQNVANRIFKKNHEIRKFSESNLAQLDVALKDARAAGVSETELLESIGGTRNLNEIKKMMNSLARKITSKQRGGGVSYDIPQLEDTYEKLDSIRDAVSGTAAIQEEIAEKEQKINQALEELNGQVKEINEKMKNVGL